MINQYLQEVTPFMRETFWGKPQVQEFEFNPDAINDKFKILCLRRDVQLNYSFAIPNHTALETIASYGDVIEIGSGGGYWAWLLEEYFNINVHCIETEDRTERWNKFNIWKVPHYGKPEDSGNFPERTLFLCWPPYDTDMAARALNAYLEAGGNRLIYIGEGGGGCTGDDDFHRILFERMHHENDIEIPQWYGVRDRLFVYELISTAERDKP